jgi:isoprenylcysteine carboxyl methyltransferase (ICMT) family protein YpbQ
MKDWYKSKIVWAMVFQSLISILLLVQEWYSKQDFSVPGCIGLAVGVLVIVLRVWFTDEPIDNAYNRVKHYTE